MRQIKETLLSDLEAFPVKVLESIHIHSHGIIHFFGGHHASPTVSAKEVAFRTCGRMVGSQCACSLVGLELLGLQPEPEVALAEAERAVACLARLDLGDCDGVCEVAAVATAMVGLEVFLGHGDVWGYCDI